MVGMETETVLEGIGLVGTVIEDTVAVAETKTTGAGKGIATMRDMTIHAANEGTSLSGLWGLLVGLPSHLHHHPNARVSGAI